MSLIDAAAFTDSGAADAIDVGRILRYYRSPYAGQAQAIVQVAQRFRLNPLVILAVMQEQSGFGAAPNLKPENIDNPFAIHFAPKARGIAKLRLPNGQPVTFQKSLEAAAAALATARAFAQPLPMVQRIFAGEANNWTLLVQSHYAHLKGMVH